MDLPASQTALLSRLVETNPNLAVVLANGSVVRLSDWEQHAKAVLECWLSGQAAGGAAADLLLGAANPSGRLAETLPLRLEDTPSYLNFPGEAGHVRYGEVSSSATAASTPSTARSTTRSGMACPIPASGIATSAPTSPAVLRTVASSWRSPAGSPTPATPREGGRPAVRRRPGCLDGPPGPRAEGIRQGRPTPPARPRWWSSPAPPATSPTGRQA
jgi:hypothetical protein